MATEYDLLRLLLSRQEKHNQRTATTIDKRINITATTIDKRINITTLLLSLFRTRPSWLGAVGRSRVRASAPGKRSAKSYIMHSSKLHFPQSIRPLLVMLTPPQGTGRGRTRTVRRITRIFDAILIEK